MDALSQVLQWARVRVLLDVRCQLGGGFSLDHDALPGGGDGVEGEAAFHLVLAGQCRIQVAGRDVLARAGDLVLLTQGSRHVVSEGEPLATAAALQPMPSVQLQAGGSLPVKTNVAAADDASVDLLCGRYRYASGAGQLMTRWLPEVLQVHLPSAQPPGDPGLQALMALLRREAGAAAQPGAHAIVDGLGQALLGMGLRAAAQGSSALPAGLLALLADARLAPSVRAVLAAPAQAWTIERLARSVAMSRATYARHFGAVAGCSVADAVLRLRMMQACDQLLQRQHSVAAVADAVGYGSEAAFATAFKRVMGETPVRWRRAQRVDVAVE